MRELDAEYYLLLNSDVEVTPRWLDPLLAYMDTHLEMAACQPKLLSYHAKEQGREMFEYAGACGGFLDRYGYPFCRGRVMSVVEEDRGQYDTVGSLFWATGAALMVRAADYWKVGGLDGRFFAHMEEIDFCWRLRSRGRGIACVPESRVYHVGGDTLNKENPRKTYLNFRNNLLMLYKNLPHKGRRKALIVRRLLDTIAWAKSVASMQWGDAGAILRAHRDFRRMKHAYDTLPSPAENLIKGAPDILTSYYLKGKKEYSRLRQ